MKKQKNNRGKDYSYLDDDRYMLKRINKRFKKSQRKDLLANIKLRELLDEVDLQQK